MKADRSRAGRAVPIVRYGRSSMTARSSIVAPDGNEEMAALRDELDDDGLPDLPDGTRLTPL